MDKYEYKVRAEEINSLIEQKKYADAVKIADTIDWRRVKSAKMLCKVSELYKMNRRYEDSKEILLLANEHLPNSRNIIFSLCELSIKLEEIVPALEYYKQFKMLAPNDTKRYILQYRLYEAQDVSLEERIAVLEEYKKRDYCEKWGYELAYLYHRIGLATRCVEECDDLILWFGEGKYVIKAMELKMLHAPLSTSQQEKYDRRFETESTAYVVKKPDESREAAMKKASQAAAKMLLESPNKPIMSSVSMETIPSMPIQIKSVEVSNAPTMRIPSKNVQSELENDGDTIKIEVPEIPVSEPAGDDDIEVKTMDVGKYNTINLQKELAQNLAAVMQQEDMEATDATKAIPVDSINGLMPQQESPEDMRAAARVIVEEFFSEEEPEELTETPDATEVTESADTDMAAEPKESVNMATAEESVESADTVIEEEPTESVNMDTAAEHSESADIDTAAEPAETETSEPTPLTDTAVTKAVIEEVRRALGDEPRETITEEDLLNSLNESDEESEKEPTEELQAEIPEETQEEEITKFEYNEPVIIGAEAESAIEPEEMTEQEAEPEAMSDQEIKSEAETAPEILTDQETEPEAEIIPEVMSEPEIEEDNSEDSKQEESVAIEPLPGIFSTSADIAVEPEVTEMLETMTEPEATKATEIPETPETPEVIEEPKTTEEAEAEVAEEPKEVEPVVIESEPVSSIIIESIPQSELDEIETTAEEEPEAEDIQDDFRVPPTFEYKEPVIILHEETAEPEPAEELPEEPVASVSVPPVAIEQPVILQPVAPAQGVSGVSQVQVENPDAPLVEKQITGQLTFNDIVAGWEGTKKAAEEKRLEEMRKKIMAETGPLLQEPEEPSDKIYPTDLNIMTPVLDVFDKSKEESSAEPTASVLTPDDEVEELTDIQLPTMDTAEINGLEEKLLSSYENAEKQQITTPLDPIDISGIPIGNTDQIEMAKKDFDSELERQVMEALEEKEPEPETKTVFHTADFKIDEPKPETKAVFHTEDFKIDEPAPEKEEKKAEKLEKPGLKPIPGAVTELLAPIEPTPPRHTGPRLLTKEEKDLFGAISQTKKMQEDIANAIDNMSLYPSEGNVLITGEKGVGTVEFAKNLIKVLASADKRFSGRVAKVTGEQLNTRNIKDTLDGLHNGALIVEHAGELTDFTLIALSDYLRESHQDGIILFFEDTKMGMGSLCAKENMPIAGFNVRVDISVLDNDGLVNYGKEYALAQDFSIDEMGVLAMYTKISERQTIEHAVTVDEVKQIVDEAIQKAQKSSIGHFMDVVLKKRWDDDDMIILREKDFL